MEGVAFAPWVSSRAVAAYRCQADGPPAPTGDLAALRSHYDAFNRRHLAEARNGYAVDVIEQRIDGVRVDVVTPADRAADARTLLCLHGGAFMWGRGAGALLEAVPVAATTGMRVIAVEYSLAPEQPYPAAVEDVLTVYRWLRTRQAPESIGIYGCSAGGILTAQTIARMIVDHLPLPGAIAMLSGTGLEMHGDAAHCALFLNGGEVPETPPKLSELPYFAGADCRDPLVLPGEHPEMLERFPPSLLVTGTRDFAAGPISVMHRRLSAAGVAADLLHFDGMWHAFHMATTLPESRETFAAIARFFDRHLGTA